MLTIEVIGYLGSFMLVGAYWMNVRNILSTKSLAYFLLNIGGAFFIMLNTVHHEAIPATLINLFWILIAILGLYKYLKQRKT